MNDLLAEIPVDRIISWGVGAITILGGICGAALWLIKLGARLGILESRVGDILGFIWRRAQAETVKVGWAEFRSPLNIKITDVKAAIGMIPFIKEIVEFYEHASARYPKLSEPERMFLVERKFGDRILKEICAPQNVDQGACLVALLAVVKDELKDTLQGEVKHGSD